MQNKINSRTNSPGTQGLKTTMRRTNKITRIAKAGTGVTMQPVQHGVTPRNMYHYISRSDVLGLAPWHVRSLEVFG
jgi:hypothetical protein